LTVLRKNKYTNAIKYALKTIKVREKKFNIDRTPMFCTLISHWELLKNTILKQKTGGNIQFSRRLLVNEKRSADSVNCKDTYSIGGE